MAGRLPRIRSKRRRRLRTHRLAGVLIVFIVLVSIGGALDLGYVSLKSNVDRLQADLTADLVAGQRELEAGKTALKQANANHDPTLVDQAIAHFSTAKDRFIETSQLADGSKLLRYLEYAPSVGDLARSRHATVDQIAQMGVLLSLAGGDLSSLDGQLIKPPVTGEAGRTLLTVLNQANTELKKVRTDLAGAQKAAAQVNAGLLPSAQQATFLKARDSIASALAGLDEFQRLVPVMTEVLGGSGARTYLVEQVNPAELRAGGGFISTYSLLRADQGSLKLVRSGDAYDLANPRPLPWQAGFIPMPMPYREVIPDTSWSFVDSNIYPDFPSNATTAENFAQPRTGHVDGVISMDFYTVAQMLQLTGPMDVPGYGIKVDASNFIPQLMRFDVASLDYSRTATHKAILSSLAGPLLQRIASLPANQWPALLATLNGAASERHLQLYFDNPIAEAEMDRIGWSGRINPNGSSDFLMEVESNYYGDKANYFLTRHFTVVLERDNNVLHHRVTVDIVNNEPCGTEERTLYRSDVRLYVGQFSSSLSTNLQPVRYSNPLPPQDVKLLDGWLLVNCGGGRGQAVFAYDTPWPSHDKAGFQIYLQKEPGTVNDGVDVTWNYGSTSGTFHASGDLGLDRSVYLTPSGVGLTAGRPAQATLPSLSF